MKKVYSKPQILVESLLASEYYAAGCDPSYMEIAKAFLSDASCSKTCNEELGYIVIDNNPQESEYCYHSGAIKVLMS